MTGEINYHIFIASGGADMINQLRAYTPDELHFWRTSMFISQKNAAKILGISGVAYGLLEGGGNTIDIRTTLACMLIEQDPALYIRKMGHENIALFIESFVE